MNIESVKTSRLVLNKGQIEGLPANPRQWTKTELDLLAKSLLETPELFEMRPVIAVEHDGKLVVLGGNMRLSAARQNGSKEVPCIIMPSDTPTDKLAEIVIKDNGTFGSWDFDMLANEWDDLPLTDWGVPAWNTDEDDTDSKSPKDISDQIQQEYKVEVTCVNEAEQEKLYNQLVKDGYECRILTL